jgi:CMP-N-acetylneuraminic acid synthetase
MVMEDLIVRLCVVPAKTSPKMPLDKDIIDIGGKPLIYHTFDVIGNYFDLIIVPTDSREVYEVVNNYLCDSSYVNITPINLDANISGTMEIVDWCFVNYSNDSWDQIWMCPSTSPFRVIDDVIDAQVILSTKNIDGIISVTNFEFPPDLGLVMDDEFFISKHNQGILFGEDFESRKYKATYRPNGAIYGSWWDSFKIHRNFFGGKVKGYFMDRERSINIITPFDLFLAEFAFERRRENRLALKRVIEEN